MTAPLITAPLITAEATPRRNTPPTTVVGGPVPSASWTHGTARTVGWVLIAGVPVVMFAVRVQVLAVGS